MIEQIDPRQLHLVRGGAASNAPRAAQTEAGAKVCREIDEIVLDAIDCGRRIGEVESYRSGWRWGVLCGLLWGLLSGVGAAALARAWGWP